METRPSDDLPSAAWVIDPVFGRQVRVPDRTFRKIAASHHDVAHLSRRDLLIAIALFKIERFLATGLRLRTACDLVETARRVTRPVEGFTLPTAAELATELTRLFAANTKHFAEPRVTALRYSDAKAKGRKAAKEAQ